MKDPLTQFSLLLPQPARQRWWKRFCYAVRSLPQLRAFSWSVHCIWRFITGALYFGFWHCWRHFCLWGDKQYRRFMRLPFVVSVIASVNNWWKSVCRAVWALPQYQFLRQVHHYFNRNPITRFIFYTTLLLALELPSCLNANDSSFDNHIYLLVDDKGPQVIQHYPTKDYDCASFYARCSSAVGGDSQLVFYEDQDVIIRRDNDIITAVTRHETVANLLRRMNIPVVPEEMVAINLSGDTPLIHISDELRYERIEESFVPFSTKMYSNYLLAKGTYNVVQTGQVGTITDTYQDVYRMGEIIDSHLISRSDSSAVTQIVEYGHLVTTIGQDVKAVSAHSFHNGSEGGYLVFENGDSMIYTKKVVNNATAYYGGTITATGHKVGVGVIAVDPKVYPYGTSMYIGAIDARSTYYGIGTAYDCGGAVKGNIIDLWYPSYQDCVHWGRRNVTCYILQEKRVT